MQAFYDSLRRTGVTLLCHQGLPINRHLSPHIMEQFYLSSPLAPEKPLNDVNLDHNEESLVFYYLGNKEIPVKTVNAVMKAIFYTFAEHINYPLPYHHLIELAAKKLPNIQLSDVKKELDDHILTLVFNGTLQFSMSPPQHAYAVAETPKVSNLVRMQVKYLTDKNLYVTNLANQSVAISLLDKFILQCLDGKHAKAEIIKKLIYRLQKGDITVNRTDLEKSGKPIVGAELREILASALDNSLNNYKVSALLVDQG